MSILDYFRYSQEKSATVAKERLQIIVAHQRGTRGSRALESFVPKLQQELLDVVKKYVEIDNDQVKMQLEKEGDYEILEVNIPLPEGKIKKS